MPNTGSQVKAQSTPKFDTGRAKDREVKGWKQKILSSVTKEKKYSMEEEVCDGRDGGRKEGAERKGEKGIRSSYKRSCRVL